MGPSYMHSVRINSYRGGARDMAASARGGVLCVVLSDETVANVSHLGKELLQLYHITVMFI